MPGAVAGRADGKHHRHFNKNADHRSERRARLRTKKSNRRSNRQLEEVGSPDERPRRGYRMLDFSHFIRP